MYDLHEHREYHYNMGDVVVRLQNVAPAEGVGGAGAGAGAGVGAGAGEAGAPEGDGDGGQSDEGGWETLSEHTECGDEEGESGEEESPKHDPADDDGGGASDGAQPEGDAAGANWSRGLLDLPQSPRLPHPWEARRDPNSGEVQFVHPPTGVVRRAPPPKLPLGWTMHVDRASGKVYYHNRRSGESRWRCPVPTRRPGVAARRVPERWVGELLEIKDGMLHVQWLEGESSWVRPSEVWVVSNDEEQHWEEEEEEEESDWETVNGSNDAEPRAVGEADADGLERSDVLEQMQVRPHASPPLTPLGDSTLSETKTVATCVFDSRRQLLHVFSTPGGGSPPNPPADAGGARRGPEQRRLGARRRRVRGRRGHEWLQGVRGGRRARTGG